MKLKWFNDVDEYVREERQKAYGNPYTDIDLLPLTSQQKKCVVEYLAQKFWRLLLDLGIQDGHCKSYDPLVIEEYEAHTYVFDLEDGGRHHKFKNLKHLEDMLYRETLGQIKNAIENPEDKELCLPINKILGTKLSPKDEDSKTSD